MRMSYLKSGILFIGCLVFLLSCQKQSNNPPEIAFLTPLQSQTEILGDALFVDIDIMDDIEVESYQFSLTSESGFKLFEDKKTVQKSYHQVSYSFDVTTNENQTFDIAILVKDNDGNETEQSISVTLDK